MRVRRDVVRSATDGAAAAASWYLALPFIDVIVAILVLVLIHVGDKASWIAHPPVGDELTILASDVAGWAWAGFAGILAGLVFFYALTGTRDSSDRVARANRRWGVPMFWAWTSALSSVLVLALVSSFARSPVDAIGWVLLALGLIAASGAVRTTTILLMWIRLLIADDEEQQRDDAAKTLDERLVLVDDAVDH